MSAEVFIVSKMDGASRLGDSGSDDTGSSGLLFTMADTYAMKVTKTSWVVQLDSEVT